MADTFGDAVMKGLYIGGGFALTSLGLTAVFAMFNGSGSGTRNATTTTAPNGTGRAGPENYPAVAGPGQVTVVNGSGSVISARNQYGGGV